MSFPVQIEFDGIPPSDAITNRIWTHIERLERLFPRVVDGRVVVSLDHHHHRKGNLFRIRIEMNTPGKRLVVDREHTENHAHHDVYVALRDAFYAMQRILQEYAHKLRGEVKKHVPSLNEGYVTRLLSYEGYGFIQTADEREIFFDAHAIVNDDFDKLVVGAKVRFCEEPGEKGPQASTVYRVAQHASHVQEAIQKI